jgi:hypothetical protein
MFRKDQAVAAPATRAPQRRIDLQWKKIFPRLARIRKTEEIAAALA